LGAAFARGAAVDHEALFEDRFTRPFALGRRPRFFANPCELAPALDDAVLSTAAEPERADDGPSHGDGGLDETAESTLELLRGLVAARVELPRSAVSDDHSLLRDLHLSSLAVGQIVAEAARRRGLAVPVAATHFANATLGQLATALDDLVRSGAVAPVNVVAAGVDAWIRAFTIELVEAPASEPAPSVEHPGGAGWRVIGPTGSSFVGAVEAAFRRCEGEGVVVCLPPAPTEHDLSLLLDGARAVLAASRGGDASSGRPCSTRRERDASPSSVCSSSVLPGAISVPTTSCS
jgi:enediyne polyketide synthase